MEVDDDDNDDVDEEEDELDEWVEDNWFSFDFLLHDFNDEEDGDDEDGRVKSCCCFLEIDLLLAEVVDKIVDLTGFKLFIIKSVEVKKIFDY